MAIHSSKDETQKKAAKNKANAQKLMEFLTTRDSQQWYAEVNYEYPILLMPNGVKH